MDAQKWVINIIKRPVDIGIKYLCFWNINISTSSTKKPGFQLPKRYGELPEFWAGQQNSSRWRNHITLKVNNFISVNCQTPCTRIISKKWGAKVILLILMNLLIFFKFWKTTVKRFWLPWWKIFQVPMMFLGTIFGMEAWFSSYAIAKETPAQVFSYEFCKVFKNNYFVEHMW